MPMIRLVQWANLIQRMAKINSIGIRSTNRYYTTRPDVCFQLTYKCIWVIDMLHHVLCNNEIIFFTQDIDIIKLT